MPSNPLTAAELKRIGEEINGHDPNEFKYCVLNVGDAVRLYDQVIAQQAEIERLRNELAEAHVEIAKWQIGELSI